MTGGDPPPDVRLALPAVRASLPLIRHVVATLVEAQPLGPRRQEEVLLALSAAAADAIRHALRDGPPPPQIVIEARVRGGRLVISIIEDGPGVAPLIGTGDVPGSLALIGAVADRLELGRTTAGGASTRMSFFLSGPRAAD
jgi:anti-sigma regulatory factor (Ser/Thr protein kinase)